MKTAFITGITGQDGSYLAKLLLEKGYKVVGGCQPDSKFWRLEQLGIIDEVEFTSFDLCESSNIFNIIEKYDIDEFYNLAAQSVFRVTSQLPTMTADVNALGVCRILDAIRHLKPEIRFFQASSSEMFGNVDHAPQNEKTPFKPTNPYGISKLFSHWITVNYRESYDMFAVSGILYNHESPLRTPEFVTRKISSGVAKIKKGLANHITLGNLDVARDWGYAPDYVEAMWLMLQQNQPEDYVISTGNAHTVRDFLQIAFDTIGIKDWQPYIKISKDLFRRHEANSLYGDSTKAKEKLDWSPRVSFEEMIQIMVENDIKLLEGK